MGNNLCMGSYQPPPQRRQVDSLDDLIPHRDSLKLFRGKTMRYCDVSVSQFDNINNYNFTLKIDEDKQLKANLQVLNQLAHKYSCPNYQLDILKRIIMDPMDQQIDNCLIAVRNSSIGVDYSLRIIPFRSYNNAEFKKGLQEVWVNKQLGKKQRGVFLTLNDAFIYGVNPDQQVIVLLFERATTTLFHMGDYRKRANWPWNLPEKLSIFQNILEACLKLIELNIFHRDIRPSNIFFLEHMNRYVLGNFVSARKCLTSNEDDLMTVYGIEELSYGPLSNLIKQKTNVGIYNIRKQMYHSLRGILIYLQKMEPGQSIPSFQDKVMEDISNQLNSHVQLKNINDYIKSQLKVLVQGNVELIDDSIIITSLDRLLQLKQKQKAEEFQFRVYQLLGYYKEFTETAQRNISHNNEIGKPFKNASILKDLGNFYQQNGTGGVQYLLNACILFCKQTEQDIQYGKLADAQEHLGQAEELYIKLSRTSDFSLNLIEINRLKALLTAKQKKAGILGQGDQIDPIILINKTLSLASDKNLPIQKQMKLFLSWGVIHRDSIQLDQAEKNSKNVVANKQLDQAEERLKNGLSICENTAAFTSPSIAFLFKSHFLYELGVLYFDKIKGQHNPAMTVQEQKYINSDYKDRAESCFKMSLQIRQRESSDPFSIIQNHLALGSLYLMHSTYADARAHFKKAKIKLDIIKEKKEKIGDQIEAGLYYDLGSACYKLKEFKDAQLYYQTAIKILTDAQLDQYWKCCVVGNLALSKLQCGQTKEAYDELKRVKEIIRLKNGAEHYDYIFLQTQEQQIRYRFR